MQQMDALRAAGCDRIFKDKAVRATAKKRPALSAVRQALKPGDTFVVTAIDRAFRSTADAIAFLDEVMRNGVTFRSLAQHIDTRTPEGRKWYIDAANSAEYEEKVAFLEALCLIMKTFVDIGWGVDSIQRIFPPLIEQDPLQAAGQFNAEAASKEDDHA
jgi:FMN-dependent NADH-azoreductase